MCVIFECLELCPSLYVEKFPHTNKYRTPNTQNSHTRLKCKKIFHTQTRTELQTLKNHTHGSSAGKCPTHKEIATETHICTPCVQYDIVQEISCAVTKSPHICTCACIYTGLSRKISCAQLQTSAIYVIHCNSTSTKSTPIQGSF